jgi:hypothetical protein
VPQAAPRGVGTDGPLAGEGGAEGQDDRPRRPGAFPPRPFAQDRQPVQEHRFGVFGGRLGRQRGQQPVERGDGLRAGVVVAGQALKHGADHQQARLLVHGLLELGQGGGRLVRAGGRQPVQVRDQVGGGVGNGRVGRRRLPALRQGQRPGGGAGPVGAHLLQLRLQAVRRQGQPLLGGAEPVRRAAAPLPLGLKERGLGAQQVTGQEGPALRGQSVARRPPGEELVRVVR